MCTLVVCTLSYAIVFHLYALLMHAQTHTEIPYLYALLCCVSVSLCHSFLLCGFVVDLLLADRMELI